MSDDDGWEAALDEMTELLASRTPFCHIRFGDGELNAACGIYDGKSANCDGVVYNDQIAVQMRRVFEEMREPPKPGCERYIPGGTCVADKRHAPYLKNLGYTFTGKHLHRPDDWVPCHVICAGVTTLRTMPMIQSLMKAAKRDTLWLVGSPRLRGALRSRLIEAGEKAILDVERIVDFIRTMDPHSTVMYCAGTPGKVMAWDAWKIRPDITHLDMGHFFDRAYGTDNRMWHDSENPRRVAYDTHFAKLIRE